MNSENSKTSDSHRVILNFTNRIDVRRKDKYVAWSNLSIYYTRKNIKKSYKNNKFKILDPTWNEELPDGSYSVPDIQDYCKYILKRHKTVLDNPSTRIYINKIENRITFKINLDLFTPETMKLFGTTKSKIIKNKKVWKCALFRNYGSSISTL